ncbi:MAG: ABC transporter substrate-binding protein [Planctomycetota bacterium]
MQSRFGVKDFFTILLLLAVLISVWLSMTQRTRMELAIESIRVKLVEMERQDALLQRQIEKGFAGGGVVATGAAPAAVAAQTNDAWARPGVAITRWPSPTPETDPASIAGFAIGGEFTEIFEAQPAKLVPYIQSDVYGTRVLDRVCEGLGSFNAKTLKMEGALADGWQVDPDGLWIRAHINPRARFSDGVRVTAEDVRWTYLDFIGNPLIEAERTRSIQDNLKTVKVIDEQTVEFEFKEPSFTNTLVAFGNPVLPKHWYSKFEPSQINQGTGLMMGSGQFKLERLPSGPDNIDVQWTPGTDVVLVRNEQYWAEKPPLERLRFKVVSDELGRLVSLRNGEGSMILPSSPQFNKVLREDADFEKAFYALKWVNMRCGYSFIAWQCGPRAGKALTPFHDARVRRAMTMLLDRERMIRDIWDGIGIVAKGPMNPESPASDPALKPLPFNPDQAKVLLAEAGWKDRNGDGILENEAGDKFTFEYTYASGGEIAERLARFVKDSFTNAGILVTTRPVDWSRYQDLLKLRDFDAITMGWGNNAPESDPRQIWHSESTREGGDNFTQWRNADADALIEQGRRSMVESDRMLVWRQLEAVIADQQPYTFVRVAPWLRFVDRRFGNVNMYRSGLQPEEFFRTSVPAPAY